MGRILAMPDHRLRLYAVLAAVLVLIVGLGCVVAFRQPGAAAARTPLIAATQSAASGAGEPPAVPGTGKYYLGVSSDPDTLSDFDNAAALKQPGILGGYVAHEGELRDIIENSYHLAGTIPMVSWGVDFTGGTVVSGAKDAYLERQAQEVIAYGKPVFIRLDWEMNGSWYEQWGSGHVAPADYIAAWRHIRQIFWAAGATNAAFVWCPNVGQPSGTASQQWYPGDSYVDWIGVDAYPQSNGASSLLYGPDGLDAMANFAALRGKPTMMAEWAPTEPDVPQPFDLVFAWAQRHPDTVKALVYFNYGSAQNDHFLTDHPVGAAEYRSLIAKNRAKIYGPGLS